MLASMFTKSYVQILNINMFANSNVECHTTAQAKEYIKYCMWFIPLVHSCPKETSQFQQKWAWYNIPMTCKFFCFIYY